MAEDITLSDTTTATFKDYVAVTGVVSGYLLKLALAKLFANYTQVGQASINFIEGACVGEYRFHITNRESITFESEITDNYIDTNCPIQDHIVKKPITITLVGVIGRYYHDITEDISNGTLYYRNFTIIPELVPKIPANTLLRKTRQLTSRISGGSGIVNRIVNGFMSYAYGWVRDKLTEMGNEYAQIYQKSVKVEDKQTEAFLYFENLWNLSLPVTVKTSWKTYDNMYITSLKPMRDGNADITEFTITLKQLSKISSIVANTKQKIVGGNREMQSQSVSNNGRTNGLKSTVPTEKLKFTNSKPNIIKVN